jgi:hypothetical protein
MNLADINHSPKSMANPSRQRIPEVFHQLVAPVLFTASRVGEVESGRTVTIGAQTRGFEIQPSSELISATRAVDVVNSGIRLHSITSDVAGELRGLEIPVRSVPVTTISGLPSSSSTAGSLTAYPVYSSELQLQAPVMLQGIWTPDDFFLLKNTSYRAVDDGCS